MTGYAIRSMGRRAVLFVEKAGMRVFGRKQNFGWAVPVDEEPVAAEELARHGTKMLRTSRSVCRAVHRRCEQNESPHRRIGKISNSIHERRHGALYCNRDRDG